MCLVRKSAILTDKSLVNLFVLTEENDLVDRFLAERIACDVLDDGRETLVFDQHLEVNGIIGREIPVFWFYAC